MFSIKTNYIILIWIIILILFTFFCVFRLGYMREKYYDVSQYLQKTTQPNIISYINNEQTNTTVDLQNKINNNIVINDIEVLFDIKNVTQTHVNFITDLCQILDANELEIGNFDYDIFNLVVNKIKHYDMDLIKCNN